MSSPDWADLYNFQLKQDVTAVIWEGAPLPLTPYMLEIFQALLKGRVPSGKKKSQAVTICVMKQILHDVGFPLTIKNTHAGVGGHEPGLYYICPLED